MVHGLKSTPPPKSDESYIPFCSLSLFMRALLLKK